MKRFFTAFIWFLVLAFIAFLFHFFLGKKICGACQSNSNEATKEQIKERSETVPKLTKFMITDTDGKSIFKFSSNFVINSKNGEVEIPESMLGFKDSIYNYLNNNQGKELMITAKYLKNEGESTGLDRAVFLKNLLVKQAGINPNRIIPKTVLSDYSYNSSSKYANGIAMLFRNSSEDTQKAFEQSISNRVLYSEFAAVEFKADRTLQAYAFELKNYLNKYPDKKVTLTGHTDNVGNEAGNYKFGLKRAKNVMNYLVSQGINENSLKALSKGETAPIASNETDEGRGKNRRITIEVH